MHCIIPYSLECRLGISDCVGEVHYMYISLQERDGSWQETISAPASTVRAVETVVCMDYESSTPSITHAFLGNHLSDKRVHSHPTNVYSP